MPRPAVGYAQEDWDAVIETNLKPTGGRLAR